MGRNLSGKGLSLPEAFYLLANDVHETWELVLEKLPWAQSLSEARQGVLLNMAFNLGIDGLLGFKQMLLHMRYGRWTDAARELVDSTYAKQVGKRAERLAQQLIVDEWQ